MRAWPLDECVEVRSAARLDAVVQEQLLSRGLDRRLEKDELPELRVARRSGAYLLNLADVGIDGRGRPDQSG